MPIEVFAVGVAAFLDIFIGEEVRRARQRIADQRTDKQAEQAKQAALTAEQQAEQARFADAAQAYRQNLLDHHNRLRVFGKEHDDTLDNIFIDAYLLERRTAREIYGIRDLHEGDFTLRGWSGRERQRQNGMAIVERGENLYILGKPGAGKTTFLKWATARAAQRELPRVPIFVSLHDYANSDHAEILPFIADQFVDYGFDDPEAFIEGLLRSGEAMVLFDGLDEVKQEENGRLRLSQQLRSFATRYRDCQILITCRIAATEYDFTGFQTVEVADFTDEQVLAYAEKWFGAQTDIFRNFQQELTSAQNAAIKELCNSPLLLSMLCLDYGETGKFPVNRAGLYKRALDVLLHRWDARRGIQRDEITYRELTPERKVEMFSHIAYPAFRAGQQFFEQSELETQLAAYLADLPNAPDRRDLNGRRVLKTIEAQHSILVERAREIYSFSHLTFQEYFTARYIVENREDGTLDLLLEEGLTDRRWREVFLLVVSMLPRAANSRFLIDLRATVDRIIVNDEAFNEMLKWATKKTEAANVVNSQRAAIRLAYVLRAFSSEAGHDRFHIIDYEPQIVRYKEPGRILDSTGILDSIGAFDLYAIRDFDNLQALVDVFGVEVGVDFGLLSLETMANFMCVFNSEFKDYLTPFRHNFDSVVMLCNQSKSSKLVYAMGRLSIPSSTIKHIPWDNLTSALHGILRIYRDIGHDRDFSPAQVTEFHFYILANELLVQCLKLAIVPNRREIEASLLLPPGAWSPPTEE